MRQMMDEANVQIIVGQFVDDTRGFGRKLLDLGKIAFSNLSKMLARHAPE